MSERATRSVAIVGASPDPGRYSHQAVQRYAAAGWTVWPIHPTATDVAGVRCWHGLAGLPGVPDIVCMYVRPEIGRGMLEDIVATGSRVLWLNPGAEDDALVAAAAKRGLRVVQACTLVVLSWGDPWAVAMDTPAPITTHPNAAAL